MACFSSSAAPLDPARLNVPPGFQVDLLTDAVPGARGMTLGRQANGQTVVFVGSGSEGRVYAVEMPAEGPATVRTVASGLQSPIGVAYRQGALYVSAISRIVRFDGIDDRSDGSPKPVVVTDTLPSERHHGAKYIAFGPDGKLYVGVGAPCNVCEPALAHGLILRMNADGSGSEVVARGVRNSVGFDWSPIDRALWFTDNGRDMLGDDVPGDELNRLGQRGQHFGFPYCHQGSVPDPQFGSQRRCAEFTPPASVLGAHVAALGMRFYGGTQFPAEYRGSVFIAEHGSWNRTRRSGYRVVRVPIDAQGRAGREQPFIDGWLEADDQSVTGRPADVLVLPDGSLLVSDQLGGALYRVRYARR